MKAGYSEPKQSIKYLRSKKISSILRKIPFLVCNDEIKTPKLRFLNLFVIKKWLRLKPKPFFHLKLNIQAF